MQKNYYGLGSPSKMISAIAGTRKERTRFNPLIQFKKMVPVIFTLKNSYFVQKRLKRSNPRGISS